MYHKLNSLLILSIIMAFTFVNVQASDWCDDFEGYPPGTSVGSNWVLSGNISSIADPNIAYTGNQSLKMFGTIGGCWAAVADRSLETTFPMKITGAVRNGTENLSGCHYPYRAEMGLRAGSTWTDPGAFGLFGFIENGDLIIFCGNPYDTITGFNLEQWYEFEFNIWITNDSLVHTECWFDGNNVGHYSREVSSLPHLLNASHLDISAQEGTAWFDDVCVSAGSELTNSLLFPSVAVSSCDSECIAQPVMTNLSQPINGASIPIEIPDGVDSICDVSFDGLLTQDWDIKGDSIDYENGWIHVYLANSFGYRIPDDTTTVFNIHFTAARECTTSHYIHWDTALSDDPTRSLLFSDTNDMDLTAYFDLDRDSTEILGYMPGDVNDDGSVNIADLTYLVGYLFRGGPAPCVMNAADCNGSCTGPNIADLTYLVSYLFQGGPAPVCGCLGGGEPALKMSADISVSTAYENGITTITLNSPVDLRGLQLVVSGDEAAKPVSLADSRLELLCGNNSNEAAIGLVDLQGEAIIEAGTQRVIQLSGEFELTEAIVSDMNHRDIAASISAARAMTLPTEFALNQNYPNPFNPTTEISFSLPSASDVKLEVYNIMGQRVVTLADGYLEAGRHATIWDASSVASGIYFYRLTANEFVETKKMVLLK